MKKFDIEANVGKDGSGGSVTVTKEFGENIKELSDQFGADVVFAHAKASMVVALQGFLRSKMTSTKAPVTDQKELQKLVNDWKPSLRTPGKPAAEKVKEQFTKMSPEERKALLAALRASEREDAEAAPARGSRK